MQISETHENSQICEGLEEIGVRAFFYCKSLKCVIFPSTVKIIFGWAFCGCHQLTTVELREGLQIIEQKAFCFCYSMRNVVIPPESQALNCFGGECHDLMNLFGAEHMIIERTEM